MVWLGVPINCTHTDYNAAAVKWSRARDVLAGEDAVKAAGEKYLPRLDSQSEEEYAAYKARASFFGATARTLEEYLELVFRRTPTLGLGEGKLLEAFAADCDLWGVDFVRYARRVLGEVLSVGRGGSLVLWDEGAARPCVSFWRTEDIIKWRVERAGKGVTLAEVVLRDAGRLRVLKMLGLDGTDGTDGTNGTNGCVMEIWQPARDQRDGSDQREWELAERQVLRREGQPVPFIPFVFHGAQGSRPEPGPLPLAEMISANLDHYRLDADYKHGLHFAALPTAWVSGFDKGAALRIGSSAAWVSEAGDAKAGFLEFSGSGLGHIERAMERVEGRMALLGARMLEPTSVGANGVPAMVEAPRELCGLGNVVASLNQSLTRVLQLARWWVVPDGHQGGAGARPPGETAGIGFAMNTDLGAKAMSGENLTAVVAAWRAGAISRESMLEVLRRGEVLPDGRTVAQERALIHGRNHEIH